MMKVKEKMLKNLFIKIILFWFLIFVYISFPSNINAYTNCGGAPNYCAAQTTYGNFTGCTDYGTYCSPSGWKNTTLPCYNNWNDMSCETGPLTELYACYRNQSGGCSPLFRDHGSDGCCVIVSCTVTSWGACSVSCGGGTQTSNCGTTQACNTQSCCTATDPTLPVLSTPAQTDPLYQARVGVAVNMTWTGTAWGTGCPSNSNDYQVCVKSAGACDLVNYVSTGTTRSYSWTPSAADNSVSWLVRKDNGSNNVSTAANTMCVEGGDSISVGWSAWSATCGDATRTRTCTETCGNDDCIAFFAANCPVVGACTTSGSGFVQTQSRCNECGDVVTAWTAWSPTPDPLCGVTQTRTRTCSEDCGTNDCVAFFDSKVGCDVAANCSYVGNTQTETKTLAACCTATAPDKPSIVCPASELTVGVTTVLDWNDIASWGVGCPTNSNSYSVCLDDNGVGCTYGYPNTGTTSQYSWTPAVADTAAYGAVISSNGSLETWSDTCTVCVEGGYILNEGLWTWPAACGNVSRSRTCSETCGTDDCVAFFTSKVGCDVAANCSYVGNTQTETRCNECIPTAPTLTSPVSGVTKQIGDSVALTWTANAWGSACPQPNSNKFSVCVMSGAVCDLVNVDNTPLTGTTYTWTPLVADRVVTWEITANNGSSTATSTTRTVCVEGPPGEPVQVTPLDGAEITLGVAKVLNWNSVNWGIACPLNDNKYRVCVSSDTVSCDLVPWSTNSDNLGVDSKYTWTPGEVGDAYWAAIADNGTKETWSDTWSVCVEGFDIADTNYVSNWSVCGADHKRTRTCTEDCGVNDCASVSLSEDCAGTITGTLFDASDLSYCPGDIGTNPTYASIRFSNEAFGITGPWDVISAPVATDVNGNYSESVYVPGTYNYDYSSLYTLGTATEVKFECQSPTATVTTQGQTVVKDTGFWRVYSGWWQTEGGSVYAKSGVRSYIPASVDPVSDQKLILADVDSRSGVLSYGGGTVDLGTNPSATTGAPWILSLYDGLRFDYNYYKTRMDVFASTAWDGGSVIYTDVDNGYQIFKHTGDVIPLNYGGTGPTGTQKVILLVDGSVTINSNVTVPNGAFLAVIASGNITFGSAVNSAQGWFVAENISVPSSGGVDVQFNGQGSFVGWTGINLARNMGVTNNTSPAEKFTYRRDMFINAPAPMKIFTKSFSPFIP